MKRNHRELLSKIDQLTREYLKTLDETKKTFRSLVKLGVSVKEIEEAAGKLSEAVKDEIINER